MVNDKKLNKEQLEAIKHKNGPLLIIAGAGTGKTTVITERIKFLIISKLAKPEEVLALTFTEKAAKEMEERVDVAMPYGYTQMWISTFHSFCDRVLRREALHIGLDPRYKLMTEAEAIQLIRNNLFKFNLNYFRPLGNPNKFISGMLQHFSRLQDEDVTPNDYLSWIKGVKEKSKGKKLSDEEKIEIKKWEELAGAYKEYDGLKTREGVFDYGDLITKTLLLFRQRKNILLDYQKQFKYVLVDEFQDTNYAQNELVKLLAKKDKNITVVGDDDQAVYRFRGASVSNIVQFRKSFPKTKVVVLTKNYRSTQEILNKSYDLIQFNNPDRLEVVEKVNKKLISQVSKDGEGIHFIHTDRVENEADRVADKIAELTKEGKYNYRDFAILVRANNHADPFNRALQRHGIPYQFLGPGRLFKQPEVIDLISYLKILYNYEDSVAIYRLLSIEIFDISPRDLATLGNYSRKYNLSLFETCEKVLELNVSDKTKEEIGKIIEIIHKHQKLIRKETAGQLLYYFLEDTGLLKKLLSPDSPDGERVAQNVSKFFDKLKTYEVDHEDATIPAVVDWISLSSELGESPLAADSDWTEINAVNILTVHSAKGLEFPVVFLVNLVGQRFPSTERREQIPIPEKLIKEVLPVGDYHLEEERRLFYVGMTRAKDLLFFTAANYYGEAKREKSLSPFIFNALGDQAVGAESKEPVANQLSFLEYGLGGKEKKNFEIPKQHVDYLSYSQIETFRICPLHYKLKYILKVPTLPSAAASFGTSIHAALRDFYNLVRSEKKPSEKLLLNLLDANWVKEGYLSKSHEKQYINRGKKYLSGYYKKYFDKKIKTERTEESFTIPLVSKNKNERPLRIGGRIDRVDILENGKIELIDYKTSEKVPTQRDLEKDKDTLRQLAFYALAATNIATHPFNKKPEDIILSFYYFENQTKLSTTITKERIEEVKQEIFNFREEIEKSDFQCSGNFLCGNCEYKLLCNFKD